MPNITAINTLVTLIKSATDIARRLKESGQSLKEAEHKSQIADLISSLADAKLYMTELQQLLSDKDAEIENLNEQLAIKEAIEWDRPYYWTVDGDIKNGPYCQQCYDSDAKLIRLQQSSNQVTWNCRKCKNNFSKRIDG